MYHHPPYLDGHVVTFDKKNTVYIFPHLKDLWVTNVGQFEGASEKWVVVTS
jgi:hypothetical protein